MVGLESVRGATRDNCNRRSFANDPIKDARSGHTARSSLAPPSSQSALNFIVWPAKLRNRITAITEKRRNGWKKRNSSDETAE